ncbi:MAG: bifunctional folylpolyglutamate synthase/dihydrofolate synthase [Fusobacteriaceae bacterium]
MVKKIIEELYSYGFFAKKIDLENIKQICDLLGNPQDRMKIIHVAGTNGKGSTSTTIEIILLEAGYNVGKFTSPHIEKINERICFNNKDISDEDLIRLFLKIKKILKNLDIKPSFFEIMTAMMFLYMEENKVDYVILETGLGGRLDSTNIVNSEFSLITNISFDHTEQLGKRLEDIAYEKAGIIKENSVVIIGEKIKELEVAVKNKTYKELIFVEDIYKDSSFSLDYLNFKTNIKIKNEIFEFSLFGEHQYKNFLLAYQTAKLIGVSDEIIKKAAKKVKWQCRFEIYKNNDKKMLILDGAHNVAGMTVLKNILVEKYDKSDIITIVSILEDKEINEMSKILEKFSEQIILTSLKDDNKRGLSGTELKKFFGNHKNVYVENNLEKAYQLAASFNKKITIICGSFYLLSKVKEFLKNE